MRKMAPIRVTFCPLSSWQKTDCLAGLAGCKRTATLEAFVEPNIHIRTCANQECKNYAEAQAAAIAARWGVANPPPRTEYVH
jgi:hypothetical protein